MSNNEDVRILGTLRADDEGGAARVVDRLEFPAERVWSALTEHAELEHWVGTVVGDLQVGGEFRGLFSTTGWEGEGRVEVCEPPLLFEVSMDLGKPDENRTRVTLAADGDATTVSLEQWPLPLDYLAAYAAGLQIHLEDLARYLAGGGGRDTKERWDELIPGYRELAAGLG